VSVHEPVVIGAGTEWALDGMLSLPVDATAENPVPAVVIVAGSGAINMDGSMPDEMLELIAPGLPPTGNAMYRDIAEFLANNGVASIRHDKRNLTHGAAFVAMGGETTVYHEFIADALLAAEILRADPRIDSNRIFILGHSQGGMLIPRIHLAGGDFAGLIFAATTPRSMVVLGAEQIQIDIEFQMAHITPEMLADPAVAAVIAQLEAMQALIEAELEIYATIPGMTAAEAQAITLPGSGLGAYYVQDMANYPLAELVLQIDVPMLVIHAGRDFQIFTETDLPLMQEIFGNLPNATISIHPDVNHQFFPSIATNRAEHSAEILMVPARVDTALLQDLLNWILAQ
jgi:dienelactone hydrolase